TEEALGHLQRATRERPTMAEAHAKLAEVAFALGQRDDARTAARRANELDPRDATAHLLGARIELADHNYGRAIELSQKALALVPNAAPAHLVLAEALAKRGDLDGALEHFQAAHGLDRADPSALVTASVAAREAGRVSTARAFADKATTDFPAHAP